ncbi:MAG: DUF418 domain-containing protein [Gammaproteobacteria bacterium]|nr:DUF418 domain-containing protein [Gammaproteobacteria bacterium]
MTQLTPTSVDNRLHIIDALRGFALAGIFISHMVEHYLGALPPPALVEGFTQSSLDHVVFGLAQLLISGKFFALFSFLFGLSFFMQIDRAAQRDMDFRGRFIWRLCILFLIGYLHSLFYRGDILTIYAPLGLLLVFFYRVPSNVILILVGTIMAGAGRYLVFALYGEETILPFGNSDPELPYNRTYFDALQSGSLVDLFAANAVHGHLTKMEFQIGIFGRWYLTFAFFLAGLWVGRIRLFERLDELHDSIKKTFKLACIGILASVILAVVFFGLGGAGKGTEPTTNWFTLIGMTGYDLFNINLATIYLCGFILLFRRPNSGRFLARLAPYGRTALSSYFMQSLVGTFILYNWGLGLLTALTNTQVLLIALPVLVLQIMFSSWWLGRYRFGPLEWLWRSATYLSWQPFRK